MDEDYSEIKETNKLSNDFDIVNAIFKIHSEDKDKILTSDMKLASLTDVQKEYVIECLRSGYHVKNIIETKYGKKEGNQMFELWTRDIYSTCILNVNKSDNFLVRATLKYNESDLRREIDEIKDEKNKVKEEKIKEKSVE